MREFKDSVSGKDHEDQAALTSGTEPAKVGAAREHDAV
jgi:hypothetical protein